MFFLHFVFTIFEIAQYNHNVEFNQFYYISRLNFQFFSCFFSVFFKIIFFQIKSVDGIILF